MNERGIADRVQLGALPLRHNEAAVPLGERNATYSLAIKDGNAPLEDMTEGQSVGDLNGANLWRAADKTKRPLPGWSFAWAAQVALPERQRGGSGGSGGSGGGAGGGGKPTVDHNGRTPYGAVPSPTPNGKFTGFQNADGSDPFAFFGGHKLPKGGTPGLLNPEDFGVFGVQPKDTKLGLVTQEEFGIFGPQPRDTTLSGVTVTPPTGAGSTVSGAPVTDHASNPDPTAGAGAGPTGSGQSNGAGGAGGSGGGGGAGGSGAVGGGGGGIPGAPAAALPTFDSAHRLDDRYGLKPAVEPPWASKRPRGWPGVVMAGSNEDQQEDIFIPAGSALVSANAPEADPTLSTAVVDVTKEGAVDGERRVPLGDAWRVVKDVLGLGKNVLSWVLTPVAKYAPWFGGTVTDIDRKAAGTVARGAPVPVVHGMMSARGAVAASGLVCGGPLDVGDTDDKHSFGRDGDGNGINPVHISTDALYLMRARDGNKRDGPIAFEDRGYPKTAPGTSFSPVHLVYDEQTQLWRMVAEVTIDDDGPPPPDDPPRTPTPDPGGEGDPPIPPFDPLDPGSGRGGLPQGPNAPGGRRKQGKPRRVGPLGPNGEEIDDPGKLWGGPDFPEFPEQPYPEYIAPTTTRAYPRPLAQTHREIAFPAIVIKPQGFGCGTRDLRNDQRGDAAAQAKHRREDPAVLRIEGAWAKAGADCNPGIPSYTNKPGNARYLGGTANGVTGLFPPEVGMEDYASGFAPPGMSVSTAHVTALKGKVFFGSGLPDPTGGLNKSGNYWDTGTSQVLEFKSTTSAGVVDKTRTLPNRTGSIVLAPSTLTSGQLVQADANGDLVSAGSGGAVNYGGIKFSNGTIRRSINTGTGATTDELADLLYTIAYDLATTGLLADGAYLMTISPYTYEYDSAAYTFDELTCTIGTFVDLQQLSGFFKPYLFGVTTMHTQFVLDCDSYTLDQLCNVASAMLTALGV